MRALISLVLFFALAMSALGGTIVLQDDFSPWHTNFAGGYSNGYNAVNKSLQTYQGSYESPDGSGQWLASYQSSSLTERFDTLNSTTLFTDPLGHSGVTDSKYESISIITYSYLQTTLYPLESRTRVYGLNSQALLDITENTRSTYDCRELIQAGLSGGCAGTSNGVRNTDNYTILWVWFTYDINNFGEISNYEKGQDYPYPYSYRETWSNIFPSQPSGGIGTETPEPIGFVLTGAGLCGIAALRRRR